jgi:phosphate transport system substrate-binding protein
MIRICALLFAAALCRASDGISGAGGSFADPIYQKWIRSFTEHTAGLPIRYAAVGSGAGLEQLKRGEIDFAGSDFPLPETAQRDLNAQFIATVVGGAVAAYNLPNVQQVVRFTPELLSDIYLGKVKTWSDPLIKALNHNVALPDQPIALIHRADASGTSYVWTDFLSKTNVEWKNKVGAGILPQWPTGQGANGNDGMANLIAQTPFSLGYVEFVYALRHHLGYGVIKNAAGNYAEANIDSLTAAAASAGGADGLSITNAPGRNSYPIASFTWMVVPVKMDPGPKRDRLRLFLEWALSSGQREAAALGYVALPSALADNERAAIGRLWQ